MANEESRERWSAPESWPVEPRSVEEPAGEWSPPEIPMPPTGSGPASAASDGSYTPEPIPVATEPRLPDDELRLFQNYEAPGTGERIPNFAHLMILAAILFCGVLFATLATQFALHKQMFGISSVQKAVTDIHYTLGSEVLLYLFTLVASVFIFPLIWHKGFFAGLQWNLATAIRLRWKLIGATFTCLLLAATSSFVSPGPTNAPIDKIFRAPGAAWLLFVFGVSIAPFFEEMFFRGFLLPTLCTAVDWCGEKIAQRPRLPLGPNDHPRWSLGAMALGSIATSIPFALMHAEQIGHSIGPLVLLGGVSLVLCAVRLSTRSLASSTLVHACYNFVLFTVMLVGTNGFRHLDKM